MNIKAFIPGKLYYISALSDYTKSVLCRELNQWNEWKLNPVERPVLYLCQAHISSRHRFFSGHQILMFDGVVRWVDYNTHFEKIEHNVRKSSAGQTLLFGKI